MARTTSSSLLPRDADEDDGAGAGAGAGAAVTGAVATTGALVGAGAGSTLVGAGGVTATLGAGAGVGTLFVEPEDEEETGGLTDASDGAFDASPFGCAARFDLPVAVTHSLISASLVWAVVLPLSSCSALSYAWLAIRA